MSSEPTFPISFILKSQCVQNASFERFIPQGPSQHDPVTSTLSLEVRVLKPEDDVYGVALDFRLEASLEGKLSWRSELTHAGFFSFPPEMTPDMIKGCLVTGCASFLLPFARRLLAELSPTLPNSPLSAIDFEALLDTTLTPSATQESHLPSKSPQDPPLRFKILREELDELSFENPLTIKEFLNRSPELMPQMDVAVSAQAWPHQTQTFEVKLRVRIEGRQQESKRYICEIVTCSLIECSADPQQLQSILFLEAPCFLFPALRSKVALITQDSGLQTLLLHPLDFSTLQASETGSDAQGDNRDRDISPETA